MSVAPLCIIQVRMGSTRLPNKALLPLADGRPILAHVVERAVLAFGYEHTVVAYPATPENAPIAEWCADQLALQHFSWDGPENDVLGRFLNVALDHRWHEDSVIVRICCDDPFLVPEAMRRVAAGERLPVSVGAEAFTLAMLRHAHATSREREHLTHALWPHDPPPPPPNDGQVWTVDTEDDYRRAVERSQDETLPLARCGLHALFP